MYIYIYIFSIQVRFPFVMLLHTTKHRSYKALQHDMSQDSSRLQWGIRDILSIMEVQQAHLLRRWFAARWPSWCSMMCYLGFEVCHMRTAMRRGFFFERYKRRRLNDGSAAEFDIEGALREPTVSTHGMLFIMAHSYHARKLALGKRPYINFATDFFGRFVGSHRFGILLDESLQYMRLSGYCPAASTAPRLILTVERHMVNINALLQVNRKVCPSLQLLCGKTYYTTPSYPDIPLWELMSRRVSVGNRLGWLLLQILHGLAGVIENKFSAMEISEDPLYKAMERPEQANWDPDVSDRLAAGEDLVSQRGPGGLGKFTPGLGGPTCRPSAPLPWAHRVLMQYWFATRRRRFWSGLFWGVACDRGEHRLEYLHSALVRTDDGLNFASWALPQVTYPSFRCQKRHHPSSPPPPHACTDHVCL